ncbi:MAG: ATP-binding cassette domain-containing protein [Bacilli bacterium]
MVKENVSEKEMIKSCKTACLHDFIMSLSNGYDTIVGEGGVNLSGGERQRLAIARALIKKTEIILFDEATSALDNETQEKIQTAIHNLKSKYTILIIAHRLSTIINSDNIIMIDKGKIVAEGTHENLMRKSLKYQKLYKANLLKNTE